MPKLILDKTDELIENLLSGNEPWEIISNDITDRGRWSVYSELILKNLETGKFYKTWYSSGATECPYEEPWENDNQIELHECFPQKVKVTKYVIIP